MPIIGSPSRRSALFRSALDHAWSRAQDSRPGCPIGRGSPGSDRVLRRLDQPLRARRGPGGVGGNGASETGAARVDREGATGVKIDQESLRGGQCQPAAMHLCSRHQVPRSDRGATPHTPATNAASGTRSARRRSAGRYPSRCSTCTGVTDQLASASNGSIVTVYLAMGVQCPADQLANPQQTNTTSPSLRLERAPIWRGVDGSDSGVWCVWYVSTPWLLSRCEHLFV